MNGRQENILVIDDDAVIRQSFQHYLEARDFNVLTSTDGLHGVAMLERHSPDLVLVDLQMPVMDGLEVLTYFKKHVPNTPIVVVSGTGEVKTVVKALRLGAWDFMLKPVDDVEVLLHTVRKALERARLRRENEAYQKHLEDLVEKRTHELETLNAALVKSDKLYRSIVENQTELICRYLPSGSITFANNAFCHYFDKKVEELLGCNIMTLIFPEDQTDVANLRQTLTPDNLVCAYECRVCLPDGQNQWQQWTTRAILNDQGQVVEIQGSGRDIVNRVSVEQF